MAVRVLAVLMAVAMAHFPIALPSQDSAPGLPRAGPAAPTADSSRDFPEAEEDAKAETIPSLPQADREYWKFDQTSTEVALYYFGHVRWRYEYRNESVLLQADRLAIFSAPRSPEGGSPRRTEKKTKSGRESLEEPKDSEDGGIGPVTSWEVLKNRTFSFYADGNVRLELPARGIVLEGESFYYEHPAGFGVARNVRARTTVGKARQLFGMLRSKRMRLAAGIPTSPAGWSRQRSFDRSPLVIRARVLRVYGFEYYTGEHIELTSCDYGVPHFSVEARSASVYPVSKTPADLDRIRRSLAQEIAVAEGVEVGPKRAGAQAAPAVPDAGERSFLPPGLSELDAKRAYIIDPEESWVKVLDQPVLRLPISHWDTRWNDHLPIRSVTLGNSSAFGAFGGVDWNVNYFLKNLPLENFVPFQVLHRDSQLGFETLYLDKRGFAYGPNAEYGTRPSRWESWQTQLENWDYYGEGQIFAIDDRGDEDRTTDLPVPREDRYWGHIWHRQAIPYVGLLDLEYSRISDRAFLGEYFEDIAKEEKEQENLVYWRRNFGGNMGITGLYKVRVNDFETQTERLPEAKLYVIEQPVFGSGLYTSLVGQGAYLRQRFDDALAMPTDGFSRYDARNEWSYPFQALHPYVNARPFTIARLSYYDETVSPPGSNRGTGGDDRLSLGAGVAVSQQWSRIFHYGRDSWAKRWLGIENMKHVIVPRATYTNVFVNDLDPDRTPGIDDVDTVDLRETVAISLRNELLTREAVGGPNGIPRRARKVKPVRPRGDLELEEVQLRTRRLFDSNISFVLFPQRQRDNQGDRSSLLILDNTAYFRSISVRAWYALDPNSGLQGETLDNSISWEAVRDQFWVTVGDRLTRDRTNFLYFESTVKAGRKWIFDGYYGHDFERERDVEIRAGITRIFHRFALTFEFVEDVGEDRNKTVYVNFSPVDTLRLGRGRWGGMMNDE